MSGASGVYLSLHYDILYTKKVARVAVNCSYTRNETYATLVDVDGTYALDEATYNCDAPYIGSNYTGIYCSSVYGTWNHSAIDCHSQYMCVHVRTFYHLLSYLASPSARPSIRHRVFIEAPNTIRHYVLFAHAAV